MGAPELTVEQRVALAWLYAAAEHAPPPRSFEYRRFGLDIWARHTATPGGPEYRLPGNLLALLVAMGLAEGAGTGRFLLRATWAEWPALRPYFPRPDDVA